MQKLFNIKQYFMVVFYYKNINIALKFKTSIVYSYLFCMLIISVTILFLVKMNIIKKNAKIWKYTTQKFKTIRQYAISNFLLLIFKKHTSKAKNISLTKWKSVKIHIFLIDIHICRKQSFQTKKSQKFRYCYKLITCS